MLIGSMCPVVSFTLVKSMSSIEAELNLRSIIIISEHQKFNIVRHCAAVSQRKQDTEVT